jgi:hypothetical protein
MAPWVLFLAGLTFYPTDEAPIDRAADALNFGSFENEVCCLIFYCK